MSHQLYGHVLCYDEFRSIIRTHIVHKIHVQFIGLQMRHTDTRSSICFVYYRGNFAKFSFHRLEIKLHRYKWGETLDHVSCFSLHFFRALATSCVLNNRTEHSQGFSIC